MTNEDNSNERIIKRRILMSKTDSDLENNRSKMKLRDLSPQDNDKENVTKILQPKENEESENMKKYNYINDELFMKLKDINLQLWNIEDKLRVKELNKTFDSEFINIARDVYIKNDLRYEYKNNINKKYKSTIVEIKNYTKYN